MKQAYSSKWRKSVQPRKQRKRAYNAPEHVAGQQLHSSLSKELRVKHGRRSVRVRTGDTVKVLRGTHKGKRGKVESVDTKNARLIVSKVEVKKLQGGTAKYPLRPSNCQITALASENRRFKRSQKKTEQTKG